MARREFGRRVRAVAGGGLSVAVLLACGSVCNTSACLDELDIAVTAPSKARLAPGHYDIEIAARASTFGAECNIDTARVSCDVPRGAYGGANVSISPDGVTITVLLAFVAPPEVTIRVIREGETVADVSASPAYASHSDCTGTCQFATVAVVLTS